MYKLPEIYFKYPDSKQFRIIRAIFCSLQLVTKYLSVFQIDLHKYLRKALNMSIAMTEEVIVYAVDYIPKMAALVQAADKE